MLKIKSVRDLGAQFKNNSHKMVGQDGAYSIPLQNKNLLWFFGDTIIGKRIPDESLWYPDGKPVGPKDMSGIGGTEIMLNNTGLISLTSVADTGIDNFSYILDANSNIKQLIPLRTDEDKDTYRVWCLHGVELGSFIYLFLLK